MNNLLSSPYVAITAALLLSAGLTHSGRAAAAAAATVPAGAIKSVFDDQIGGGKDPFFPNSKRLKKQVPNSGGVQVTSGVPSWIVLNGFSALQSGKLAMINNRTFAVGEEYTLRYGNQSAKVKCITINDDSVEVEVNGSTKELKLRSGL